MLTETTVQEEHTFHRKSKDKSILDVQKSDFERKEDHLVQKKENEEIESPIKVQVNEFFDIFTINSIIDSQNFKVKRTIGHFQWLQKILLEEIPFYVLPPLPIPSMYEKRREICEKMFDIFLHKICNNTEWKFSVNFKVFLTMKQQKLDNYIYSNGQNEKGLLYKVRTIGRTIPEEKEFSTKDFISNNQKLRHALVLCIRSTRDFVNSQISNF